MDQRLLLMHQAMLGDRPRVDAYDRALAQVVTPGAIVADVGAGTLALTALALRHGAGHVYAIEADPQVAAVAGRIIEANGWADRVTLVPGDARLVRLPQRVDVVVSELMGNMGPEEDMARILRTVARRSLRPGGVVVPQRMLTHLVPAQLDEEGWGIWRDGFLDMRLDVVQELIEPVAHLHFFTRPPKLLGPPQSLMDSEAGEVVVRPDRALTLPISQRGCLHAALGYFTVTLAPGIELSNLPSYPGCNWAVWVWPLRHTPVAPGDKVRVRVRKPARQADRIITDWRLDCQLSRSADE